MSFNPEKCEVLRITNRKKNIIATNYKIHGTILNLTKNAKYLGLSITPSLSWSEHINKITKKANSTRGFIQRNLRHASPELKTQAYFTFIRPILEYSSTVWDPYTSTNINKIEMVQRKAARFVMNDWSRHSSVSTMLEHLKWQSLQARRAQSKTIMMYRISHNLIAIPFSTPYITTPTYAGTRGHNQRLFQQPTRLNTFKFSFFPSVVPLWNSLDSSIVCAPSIDSFKARLTHHQF